MKELADKWNRIYGAILLERISRQLASEAVLTQRKKLRQWQSKLLDWSTYNVRPMNCGTHQEKNLDEQTIFYSLLDKYSNGIEPLSNWTTEDLIKLMDAIDAELQNRAPPDSEYT